jgi:hypothetical protein
MARQVRLQVMETGHFWLRSIYVKTTLSKLLPCVHPLVGASRLRIHDSVPARININGSLCNVRVVERRAIQVTCAAAQRAKNATNVAALAILLPCVGMLLQSLNMLIDRNHPGAMLSATWNTPVAVYKVQVMTVTIVMSTHMQYHHRLAPSQSSSKISQ